MESIKQQQERKPKKKTTRNILLMRLHFSVCSPLFAGLLLIANFDRATFCPNSEPPPNCRMYACDLESNANAGKGELITKLILKSVPIDVKGMVRYIRVQSPKYDIHTLTHTRHIFIVV